MRRALVVSATIIMLCATSGFADTIVEQAFVPLSPAIMGQGGSYIASAQGYNSFFYNPAGFSRGSGGFTALSSSTWIFSRPDLLLGQITQNIVGSQTSSSLLNYINSQITTGGLGIGSSLGFGYIGNGFGLGSVFIMNSSLYGATALGATGDLTATLGFIGGFSFPFVLADNIKIHAGADIRPMIRMHTPITNSTAVALLTALTSGGDVGNALNSATTVYGSGIGLDLGVIAELWWFNLGLSIRDLGGTRFNYATNTFGSVTGNVALHGSFPSGDQATDTYVIPMDIGFGFAFHPDMGKTNLFFDPIIDFDMRDINGIIDGTANFWTLLHFGTEIRLINLFAIRAGLNQGYLTAGVGIKVFAFDLNMAVFTEELGLHLGDRPASGVTFSLDVKI